MTAVLHLPYSLRGSPSGTYELQTFISKGNFGSVYKATMDDGSTWAVKILAPGDTNGPEEVSKLERIRACDCPYLLCLKESFTSVDGRLCIVTPLAAITLEDRIKAGSYSVADMVAWAGQLAEALEVLGRLKIYHGDLRAPNILLSPADHIIVADFGVSANESAVGLDINTFRQYSATVPREFRQAYDMVKQLLSEEGNMAAQDIIGNAPGTAPLVSTRLKEMEEAVLERLKTAIMGRMVDTQGDMWAYGVVVHQIVSRTFEAMDVYDALSDADDLKLQLEHKWAPLFKPEEASLLSILIAAVAGSMSARPASRITPQVAQRHIYNGLPPGELGALAVKHSSTALSWTVLSKALDLQQDATAVLEDWAGKPVPEALVPLVLRLFKQRPGEAVQAQMKQVACKALGAVASSLPFEAISLLLAELHNVLNSGDDTDLRSSERVERQIVRIRPSTPKYDVHPFLTDKTENIRMAMEAAKVCVLAGNSSTSHETHAAIAKALTARSSLDLMKRLTAEHKPAFTEPFASIVATSITKQLLQGAIAQDWQLMHTSADLLWRVGTYPDKAVELMIDRLFAPSASKDFLDKAFAEMCRRRQGPLSVLACNRLLEAIRYGRPSPCYFVSMAGVSDGVQLTAFADALTLRLSERYSPDSDVREQDAAAAIVALGKIAASPLVHMDKREEVTQLLLTWAKAGYDGQHACAVLALGTLGDLAVTNGAVTTLASILARRPVSLARHCIWSLGKLAVHGQQAEVLAALAPLVQLALTTDFPKPGVYPSSFDVTVYNIAFTPGIKGFMEALFAAWRLDLPEGEAVLDAVLQGVSKDLAVQQALITLLRDPTIPADCAARVRDSLSNELARMEKQRDSLTSRDERKMEELYKWHSSTLTYFDVAQAGRPGSDLEGDEEVEWIGGVPRGHMWTHIWTYIRAMREALS